MRRPRLLVLKPGTAAASIVREVGDYERWFVEALGAPDRFHVAEIFRGEPWPDPRAFDGVIVTGSPLSACVPEPWMEAAASRLREHVERGGALLGVCFGHQLLAHAFGTPVVRNPGGREIGTCEVALTDEGRADTLFEGLGAVLRVQETHVDMASGVPAGAELLATNAKTAVQALRYGLRARTVQFHPEVTAAAMRSLVRSKADAMRAEGLDPDRTEGEVGETAAGPEILRRFEERLVGG